MSNEVSLFTARESRVRFAWLSRANPGRSGPCLALPCRDRQCDGKSKYDDRHNCQQKSRSKRAAVIFSKKA
jgi:hypothetical protein